MSDARASQPASLAPPVVRRLGRRPFGEVYDAMRVFTAERTAATPDEIWLVEHPPVYTVGQAGRDAHLPRGENRIPVVHIDRGGQITYHGPGQVLMYVLVDLRRRGLTIRGIVARLEQAVIDLLARRGVAAERRSGAPGVYVGGAKVAALGLRVRNGCTYHGLALNADMDLAPFDAIDPCGYPGLAVTDTRTLGIRVPPEALATALVAHFLDGLER